MPQHEPRRFTSGLELVAPVWLLLLALPTPEALAQTPAVQESALGTALDVIYLTAVGLPFPLLPLLAGAGLYLRTGSHRIAAGVSALFFGAWGAFHFSHPSLDGPGTGALFGFLSDGVTSALVALAGSGYVHLIRAEARRLGTKQTAVVHGVGIAFAVLAFVLLLVTRGSDKVEVGLYLVMLALSLGLPMATGSFGGVVVTMALAIVAAVFGLWAGAVANGARDAGQAFIAIFSLPQLLVPLVAVAALGWWLGGKLRTRQRQLGQP